MRTSRDSSIWKSLAGAFGDGLAFGAGLKLTQTAARHAEAEPASGLAPAEGRIGQIEQRISRIEQTPAPPFDRRVLEAVVGAVDARLKEHAGQVELRIAGMRSAIEQDQAAVRAALAQIVEERAAQIESRVPALVEERLEPVCAQLSAANREIGELRRRIAECRALLLAIGAAFRESAQQIARRAVETPLAGAAAKAELPAGVEAPGPAAEPNGPAPATLWTEASLEPASNGPAEFPPPASGELRKPGWRSPVVS